MATVNSRYEGKPLLRLLECYVLWTLNELPAKDEIALKAMLPKLQATYGVHGDWPFVVAAAVRLPPNMPATIRELWTKNTEIARKAHVALAPQQFAEMFVDQNLLG